MNTNIVRFYAQNGVAYIEKNGEVKRSSKKMSVTLNNQLDIEIDTGGRILIGLHDPHAPEDALDDLDITSGIDDNGAFALNVLSTGALIIHS